MRRFLVVAAAAAGPLLAGAPAYADGGLTLIPPTGFDDTALTVGTTGPCPLPATNALAKLYGPGFPAEGVNVIGNTAVGVSYTTAFSLPVGQTIRAVAAEQRPPVVPRGVYSIVLSCREPLGPASYTDYIGSLRFDGAGAYVRTDQRAKIPAGPRAVAPPPGTLTLAPAPTAPAPDAVTPPAPEGPGRGLQVYFAVLGGIALLLAAVGPRLRARRRGLTTAEDPTPHPEEPGTRPAAGGGVRRDEVPEKEPVVTGKARPSTSTSRRAALRDGGPARGRARSSSPAPRGRR